MSSLVKRAKCQRLQEGHPSYGKGVDSNLQEKAETTGWWYKNIQEVNWHTPGEGNGRKPFSYEPSHLLDDELMLRYVAFTCCNTPVGAVFLWAIAIVQL